MNWKFFLLTGVSCVAVCLGGAVAAYQIWRPEPAPKPAEVMASVQTAAAVPTPAPTVGSDLIKTDTDMIYEYLYSNGTVERRAEKPQYFLLGLNREGLADKLIGWEIVSFSADRIVLKKAVDQKMPKHYVVGLRDGCVAVFEKQDGGETVLKQKTDIPVNFLPPEEQERLRTGIPADDDYQLSKILEAYGS